MHPELRLYTNKFSSARGTARGRSAGRRRGRGAGEARRRRRRPPPRGARACSRWPWPAAPRGTTTRTPGLFFPRVPGPWPSAPRFEQRVSSPLHQCSAARTRRIEVKTASKTAASIASKRRILLNFCHCDSYARKALSCVPGGISTTLESYCVSTRAWFL
jgi:hypothetical protein